MYTRPWPSRRDRAGAKKPTTTGKFWSDYDQEKDTQKSVHTTAQTDAETTAPKSELAGNFETDRMVSKMDAKSLIISLHHILDSLLSNPEILSADQVVKLRQLLAEAYATIDDYWYRHLD
jgi:hypothetical protein